MDGRSLIHSPAAAAAAADVVCKGLRSLHTQDFFPESSSVMRCFCSFRPSLRIQNGACHLRSLTPPPPPVPVVSPCVSLLLPAGGACPSGSIAKKDCGPAFEVSMNKTGTHALPADADSAGGY